MSENHLYELIARKLAGEATTAELSELHDYLQQHAGDQYLYEMLHKYWSNHPNPAQQQADDEEERFLRIVNNPPAAAAGIPVRKIRYQKWWYYAAAASVIVIIGSFIFFYQNHHTSAAPALAANQSKQNEVSARSGSRSKLILPDGTQVWLNAESRLTYQHSFNKTQREVNLEGEAFFDVTHDAQRPFIVHTSGIAIKVLGTAFTVKSYATDKTIETALFRGSIEVTRNNDPDAPKVILRPHEKLVFRKEEQNITTTTTTEPGRSPIAISGIQVTALPNNKPDSILKETSWMYNKLVFDGDRFDELAAKLERWYDVHITFQQEALKQYRFKGAFKNETVQQALDALKLTAPFEYHIEGNNIVISVK